MDQILTKIIYKLIFILFLELREVYGTRLIAVSDFSPESLRKPNAHFRVRRAAENSSQVTITEFHMTSKLHSRFATVTIDSQVINNASEGSNEIAFKVQVPEPAFMTNFTMNVDGNLFVAKVMEKEDAQKAYDEAKQQNKTAGQVKQEPEAAAARGMQIFTISVNLAPQSKADFRLTYSELLERKLGIYTQRLFLQPGGIVPNLSVRAMFAEKQGFNTFAYQLPGSATKLTSSSDGVKMFSSLTTNELVFTPTVEMQKSHDPVKGIEGEFTVLYDVSRDSNGGSIIVQNQYFAHFFAPPGLRSLLKNILFIVDISGSMGSGNKSIQAKNAMLKILDDLASHAVDTFNILLFDDHLEKWSDEPKTATVNEISKAKSYVLEKLVARGGTDINSALNEGLTILLKGKETRLCNRADMIIFLTDGDPTSGVTDPSKIVSDVTLANRGRASIFSLGFGFDMKFDFLSKISLNNEGFAHRIYDESDAATQLETFYKEISMPVLCDVRVIYNAHTVDPEKLTLTWFPLHFQGREIVVAGKTGIVDNEKIRSSLDVKIQGSGKDGMIYFDVPTNNIIYLDERDVEADLTEKLWAYMMIKKKLNEMLSENLTEEEKSYLKKEALNMSLYYGFVTPLTSFNIVVQKQDHDILLDDYNVNLKSRLNAIARMPSSDKNIFHRQTFDGNNIFEAEYDQNLAWPNHASSKIALFLCLLLALSYHTFWM